MEHSIHVNDEATSKLIIERGPRESNGLDTYIIYCRSCGCMNVYVPEWFGNIKFSKNITNNQRKTRWII